jgi:hypothetical protein
VERERRAFEIYYGLPKRSYKAVAAELGVSLATIKSWARTHRWKTRLAERDAQAVRQLADQSSHRGQAENERNLKIVRAALTLLARAITSGDLKQLGELDRLIRLEEHLMGITAPGEAAGAHMSNPVVILPDDGSDPDFARFASDVGSDPIPAEEVALAHA